MKQLILSLLLALPVAACDSGTTGIDLELSPYVASSAGTNLYVIDADFEVTRFDVLVREVKVLPDKDTDAEKFKAKGEYHLDLLNPEWNTTDIYTLSAGTYKKVEFKFDTPSDGTGLTPDNSAVVVEATIDGVKVQYLAKKMDKVTLRNEEGLTIGDGDVATFLVDLDVVGWFAGVDVTALTVGDDGIAVIDESGDNKDAWKTITENVKAEIKLLRKK
ncbi:MAG: hypothetical protein EP329_25535 [Deltaproteobacteria bacterium]|nr:MAG: hypothetical protein EP329_25535 [Deltaproteobacteria bacterium]